MRRAVGLFGIALFLLASSAFAQGVQTGTVRGTVRDQQDRPIGGVAVTATSTALQAPRATVTDAAGAYTLAVLPAGEYELVFERERFEKASRRVTIPLGLTVEQSILMRAAGVRESVSVVAEVPPPISSPSRGANFTHDRIEALATPRTLQGIAQLTPAVNENAPQNNNQLVINGAFAFDNVFMVNGVDINDNLFAQPQNLYVEDAVQETQILTSGIPAEFGRFTGGVINAITRSGGNIFAGSGRMNMNNPSWVTATPFEVARGTADTVHASVVQASYEGTLGGPIVADRLWFFGSGRRAAIDSTRTLAQTGMTVPTRDTNTRGEIKLTGQLAPNHQVQGGLFASPRTQTNTSGAQNLVITPDSEANPNTRNLYGFAKYHGLFRGQTIVEAQFSLRGWRVENSGGSSTNLFDSPFLSATQCACLYNAPYFDSADPEERNNAQYTASVTNFWAGRGRHVTKAGYEFFRSQRRGGGSQSSTSYVFNSDFATNAAGLPDTDAEGHVIPVFTPGLSSLDFYPATRGATMNIDEQSLYLQDRWTVSRHLSADLGARFEHVKAESTGEVIGADTHRIVPRLAAAYDLFGDGHHIVHVGYGWYSGRYNEAQIGANSAVANPPQITRIYRGPAGRGTAFAPGFDPANYPVDGTTAAKVPTGNVFMDPDLTSPVAREFSASYGRTLGTHGYAQAGYVHRRTVDLIEDFQTRDGGTSIVTVEGVSAGPFTNIIYRNSDEAYRVYDAMEFQSQYQVNSRWMIQGHYTLQLRNEGNYEGENASQPGKPSFIGTFPEAFSAARNFPDGTLQSYQQHRLRVWSSYDIPMARFGTLSVSGLWRVDSAQVYSLRTVSPALTSTQAAIIRNAGYPDAPATAGPSNYYVFFGERGSERFKGFGLFDTSVSYNVPAARSLRPFIKVDVFNLFDNTKLIAWNVGIRADNTSPKDALGLATAYTNGPTFGTATGNTISLSGLTVNAFPVAYNGALPGGRTLRLAFGVRF